MSFWESVQGILRRSEVDELDRGTTQIRAHRAQEREAAEQLAALRRSAAEDRHPDLSAAIARRNAAR